MAPTPRAAAVAAVLALATLSSACSHHTTRHSASSAPTASVPPGPVLSGSPVPSAGSVPGAGSGGSAPAPGAASSAARPGAAGGADAGRCAGTALQAQFRPAGAAGTGRSGAVGLRNQSTAACTLTGFPDLQLLGRGDDPISTSVVKAAATPTVVRLAPGQTVWSTVSWSTTAAADEPHAGPCQPTAIRLAVFPPGQLTQLTIPVDIGAVCNYGRFAVNPLTDVS